MASTAFANIVRGLSTSVACSLPVDDVSFHAVLYAWVVDIHVSFPVLLAGLYPVVDVGSLFSSRSYLIFFLLSMSHSWQVLSTSYRLPDRLLMLVARPWCLSGCWFWRVWVPCSLLVPVLFSTLYWFPVLFLFAVLVTFFLTSSQMLNWPTGVLVQSEPTFFIAMYIQ